MIKNQNQLAKYFKNNMYGKNCSGYGRWINLFLDERVTKFDMKNINELKKLLSYFGSQVIYGQDLKKKNWFNIGGKAKIFYKAESLKDLVKFLRTLEKKENIFVIGAGSNTLITDEIYNGVVIKLSNNFNRISLLGEDIIISGTAVMDKNLSDFALENCLSGFEFLSCIPGTIGGGIKMNAGCFGHEIKDILVSIQAIDKSGNIITIPANKFNFEYRNNNLSEDLIYLSASFRGKKKNQDTIRELMSKFKSKKTLINQLE